MEILIVPYLSSRNFSHNMATFDAFVKIVNMQSLLRIDRTSSHKNSGLDVAFLSLFSLKRRKKLS